MIEIVDDPFPPQDDLDRLFHAAWGAASPDYATKVLPRSLAHVGALADGILIGLVNVAWDGGVHAFLLDTCVDPAFRRQGIAGRLVRSAAELARERGAAWLHVDFEPHLERLYRECGFRPTPAGLIALS